MNYEEAVAYLDQHAGRGVKPGLERITALMEAMGNPEHSYPVIHVAGTNGKTSTVRLAAAIAAAHGLTVGAHTSPHLERVEERFEYDLRPATPGEFAGAVTDVWAFDSIFEQDTHQRLTYFEFVVAVAFSWFAEKAVELAVIEVGLGGRWDATNVVDAQVSVITSIGLEHQSYLGDTLAAIAGEKAAILKPGGSLVTAALPSEAFEVVEARVTELGTPHRRLGRDFRVLDATRAVGGWVVDIEGIYDTYNDLYLPAHGRHQIDNLAVALASVEELFGRALDAEAVRDKLDGVRLAGRAETVGHNPLVVLDGAHNPASMVALAAAIDEEFPPFLWKVVLGVMGDKDLAAMMEALQAVTGGIYTVAVDSERARTPDDVAAVARQVLGDESEVVAAGTVEEGVKAATAAAGEDGAVLVTGSLYVVGEARSLLVTEKGAMGGD